VETGRDSGSEIGINSLGNYQSKKPNMKFQALLFKSFICISVITFVGCKEGSTGNKGTGDSTASAASASKAPDSSFKPANIEEQIGYNRAIEATVWGVPAVSMAAVRASLKRDLDANFGDIVYFSKVMDSKHEFLTANNQTPYVVTVLDLRNGPMVLEVPPATKKVAFFGSAIDSWEVPMADIGPAGEDAGKGGKYLFLPPGYTSVPPKDYIVVPCATVFAHIALRPIPMGDATTEDAVAYSQTLKTYPLSQAANPQASRYVDAFPKVWKTLPTYDLNFMRLLAEVVNLEPAQPKDAAMLGMLATLGIEKGKSFTPDATQTKLLDAAASKAAEYMQYDMLNNAFKPFWPDRKWVATNTGNNYSYSFYGNGRLDYNNRATRFAYWGTFVPKKLGDPTKLPASYYLKVFREKSGVLLNGRGLYRLNVPANTPVKDFWSIIVYELSTSAFIRTTENRVGLSSYDKSKMTMNKDGSVDLYIGEKAPAGKENNWIPTGGKDFWIMMRFYGPQQTLFDKKWEMPDVEKVR
jgi:hypothetical protein